MAKGPSGRKAAQVTDSDILCVLLGDRKIAQHFVREIRRFVGDAGEVNPLQTEEDARSRPPV